MRARLMKIVNCTTKWYHRASCTIRSESWHILRSLRLSIVHSLVTYSQIGWESLLRHVQLMFATISICVCVRSWWSSGFILCAAPIYAAVGTLVNTKRSVCISVVPTRKLFAFRQWCYVAVVCCQQKLFPISKRYFHILNMTKKIFQW